MTTEEIKEKHLEVDFHKSYSNSLRHTAITLQALIEELTQIAIETSAIYDQHIWERIEQLKQQLKELQ